MRKLVLLSFCLTACNSNELEPVFFDADAVMKRAHCAPVDALNARGSQVNDVVGAGISSILVLYGSERELVKYDSAFNPVATVSFERAGPRGVREAVSAATDGELFYIADEKQLAVKIFDATGRDRGTIRLDFIPRRIRSAGRSIVLTPFVAGNHPASLLYELRDGRPQSRSIPTARYEDGALNAFANLGSLATFADGRVVVMHETIVPFGYSLSLRDSASLTRRFAIPLPASQRSRVDRLPKTPLTDKSLADILAAALTATPDPQSGHVYYLTRSGRRVGGSWEKMIVELDATLSFVRALPLGEIRPLHMTFAPARRSLLLADDTNGWFECKL